MTQPDHQDMDRSTAASPPLLPSTTTTTSTTMPQSLSSQPVASALSPNGNHVNGNTQSAAITFRPHHLKAQELKHMASFSSMSSYASSTAEDSIMNQAEGEADKGQVRSNSNSNNANSHRHRQGGRPKRPPGGSAKRPAGKAHDWFSGGPISSHGRWFKDAQNRTLLLRGVNLCGNSKLPTTPNGSTHLNEGFFNHRDVCFLGRPFPKDQADEHFSRLRRWGLTFVRLLVPWEALEHSGPGLYDERFIDSLIELIEIMPKYGIKCFIDPHQDCWSRFSGGSGAPGWTFEAAGMDLTKFKSTGAAYVHNTNHLPGDSPPMVWPTNYTKLAASTMFTLFWAGDTFAPGVMYEGETIQQFLQNRYLACYKHLAQRLSHLEAIVGYEVMNEPHPGYIGLDNLKRYDFNSNLFFGDSPSAVQSFAMGAGIPQSIEVWVKSWPFPTKKQSCRMINTERDTVWLNGECIWKKQGIWSVNEKTGKLQVDKPDYFKVDPKTGESVNFQKFYLEFINKYSQTIQSVMPQAFVFVEPVPNEPAPVWGPNDHEENIVYAPHWYDLHSVFNKAFDGRVTHDVQGLSKGKNVFSATYFGLKGARKNYKGQLGNILNTGLQNIGNKPCLIGECGIPMDINQKQAFLSGDYGHHSKFLDAILSSMEANLLSFTLWNYNATNDNTHGDHWNGEDFSIFSLDSPHATPEISRATSPNPDGLSQQQRSGLRQQAPNFAKEAMKRAAANTADVADKMQIQKNIQATTENKDSITEQSQKDDEDLNRISTSSSSSEDEGSTMASKEEYTSGMDTTLFDLSYSHFEDEETEDIESHLAHIGGRALDAVVRPYAAKVAGEPIATEFNLKNLHFTFRFCNYLDSTANSNTSVSTSPTSSLHQSTTMAIRPTPATTEGQRQPIAVPDIVVDDSTLTEDGQGDLTSPPSSVGSPESNHTHHERQLSLQTTSTFGHPPAGTPVAFETEIFIPAYHYSQTKLEILVSDGDWRYVKERQTLYYRHKDQTPGAVHSILIRPSCANHQGQATTPMATRNGTRSHSATAPMSKEGRQMGEGGESDEDDDEDGPESDAGCLCTIM